MTTNMGSSDRIIRTVVGLVLLISAFAAGWGMLGTVIAAVLGLVLLGTAAMGYCPPYSILGINTCKSKDV